MDIQLKVEHCPLCGRVYQKNLRNMCASCTHEFDSQLASIEHFMIRNRRATMAELCLATSIQEKAIVKYMKLGKISVSQYPNLTYACDYCQSPIQSGTMCTGCKMRLNADIRRMKEDEERNKPIFRRHNFQIRNA